MERVEFLRSLTRIILCRVREKLDRLHSDIVEMRHGRDFLLPPKEKKKHNSHSRQQTNVDKQNQTQFSQTPQGVRESRRFAPFNGKHLPIAIALRRNKTALLFCENLMESEFKSLFMKSGSR